MTSPDDLHGRAAPESGFGGHVMPEPGAHVRCEQCGSALQDGRDDDALPPAAPPAETPVESTTPVTGDRRPPSMRQADIANGEGPDAT